MSDTDRTPSSRPSGGGSTEPVVTPERRPEPSTPGGGRGSAAAADRAPRGGRGAGAAALAALALGLVLGAFGMSLLNRSGGDAFGGVIDEGRYQAVILSNDKVYFGKISSASDEFFELESAFFLRETRASEDAEPERALLPVNREIHAPDNTMLIRKDEVVLVENLAKDSPILTEINRQKG